MSRIYFHSPSGEAELWGGERAWLGYVCSSVAIGLLNTRWNAGKLRPLVRPGHYLHDPRYDTDTAWASAFETAFSVGLDGDLLIFDGKPVSTFSVTLNTAMRVGNDAVQLAARIHGQCELHCYAEAGDRKWLAEIINRGLGTGVFRKNTGHREHESWEAVYRFLRESETEPVVLSFSGGDQFPNPWELEQDDGDWDGLSLDEQWHIGMEALRAKSGGLRLADPDKWHDFSFDDGVSVFDLLGAGS
jgi:hypothetical protein